MALGVAPERLFKTLIAPWMRGSSCAVVPVGGTTRSEGAGRRRGRQAGATGRAGRGRASDGLRRRRHLADRAEGAPAGGRRRLREPVPTVYVSAGRRGLQVELAPADLARLTSAVVAQIAA